MLSVSEAAMLTKITNHLDGSVPVDKAALTTLIKEARLAIAAAWDARVAQQKAAQTRDPTGAGRKQTGSGRPPTTWFHVSMGSQWAATVQGAKAAHDLVTKALTENPGCGHAPTLGSMQVQLSKGGSWWRLLETTDGSHLLEVTKCAAPAAETGTDLAPSKKRARKLKQT